MDEHHVGIAASADIERLTCPTATTFTPMPVALVKTGRRCPNRPDCSVDVVDATVMERSWA
jgi:hypothetical protein